MPLEKDFAHSQYYCDPYSASPYSACQKAMNGKVLSLRCTKVFFMFSACLLGRATILKLPQPRSKGGQLIIEHQSLCGQAPGAPRACCPLDSNLRYFAGMFLITPSRQEQTHSCRQRNHGSSTSQGTAFVHAVQLTRVTRYLALPMPILPSCCICGHDILLAAVEEHGWLKGLPPARLVGGVGGRPLGAVQRRELRVWCPCFQRLFWRQLPQLQLHHAVQPKLHEPARSCTLSLPRKSHTESY